MARTSYDTCVWRCKAGRDATCERDGLLAGVMELWLYGSLGRTQLYEVLGWLLDVMVISVRNRGE